MKRDLKAIAEKLDFNIDTQDIEYAYWKANQATVEKSIKFLTTVMLPYCKRHGYYVNNNFNLWMYQKSGKTKETKNYRFGLYRTKNDMEVFCHIGSCYVDLFILVKTRHLMKDETRLIQVTLSTKHSDDEYIEEMIKGIHNVLDHIQSRRKEHTFEEKVHGIEHRIIGYRGLMIWNSYSVKRDEDKVSIKTYIDWTQEYGKLHDGWDRHLFYLACDKYYLGEFEGDDDDGS